MEGSPDWTRTSNLPVNSRTLCQLSYGGMTYERAWSPEARNRLTGLSHYS
jgi:hypothetical protein